MVGLARVGHTSGIDMVDIMISCDDVDEAAPCRRLRSRSTLPLGVPSA